MQEAAAFFESSILSTIKKHAGRWVKDFSSSDLSLGIDGTVHLRNVELKVGWLGGRWAFGRHEDRGFSTAQSEV